MMTGLRSGNSFGTLADHLREPGRHDDRVLRLLYLRDRRRQRVPAALFRSGRRADGPVGFDGHFRRGLRRPAAGLSRVRPLWRSHRPQGDPRRLFVDDGAGDVRHRLFADVSAHWRFGPRVVGLLALLPGARPGRRVVGGRLVGDRNSTTRPTHAGGDVAPVGRAVWFHPRQRLFPAVGRRLSIRLDARGPRRSFPELGVANSLSPFDRDGPARALRARQAARDARVRRRRRAGRNAQGAAL